VPAKTLGSKVAHVLGMVFRDGGRKRDEEVEMLDGDALRARVGECKPRKTEQPEEHMIRIDGPRPGAPRTWRDVAGLSR
jgi:hypothetical protein